MEPPEPVVNWVDTLDVGELRRFADWFLTRAEEAERADAFREKAARAQMADERGVADPSEF